MPRLPATRETYGLVTLCASVVFFAGSGLEFAGAYTLGDIVGTFGLTGFLATQLIARLPEAEYNET